jgi:xylulokinase
VLEALAARTVDASERLATVVGSGIDRVLVFGGGSRSRPSLRAKARAFGLDVARVTTEAPARGAALFAGVAAGWWSSPDAAPPAVIETLSERGIGRETPTVG